jgi:hypothetical protein
VRIIGRYCERVVLPKGQFDRRSFRWKKSGKAWLLVGCRKGSYRRGTCQTGVATHVILVRSNKACRTGERAVRKGH